MAFQVSNLHSRNGFHHTNENTVGNIAINMRGNENGTSTASNAHATKAFKADGQNQLASNQNGSKRGVLEDISNKTKGFLSSVGLGGSTKNLAPSKQIIIKSDDPQVQHVQTSAAALRESLPLDQVDLHEQSKPRHCTLYVNDVFRNFRESESKYMAPADYITMQEDLSEKMRAILINWMIEVHHKFKLEPQTMHLTVNYLDRFLSKKTISRKKLQLIGCTAMLVASKYEEIYPPEAADFVYVSDHSFTKNELFQTEGVMINTLSFNLTFPSSLVFLNRYAKVASCDQRTKLLATCLLEYTMIDYSMLKYAPSMLAASSLLLALRIIKAEQDMEIDDEWNSLLVKHTQYVESDLVSCMEDIKEAIRKCHERNLKAVAKKYSSDDMMCVSSLVHV